MISFNLHHGDVLSLVLALYEAERSQRSCYPATADSYRKLREKIDAVMKAAASNVPVYAAEGWEEF